MDATEALDNGEEETVEALDAFFSRIASLSGSKPP
jgi:hypothetical protein